MHLSHRTAVVSLLLLVLASHATADELQWSGFGFLRGASAGSGPLEHERLSA